MTRVVVVADSAGERSELAAILSRDDRIVVIGAVASRAEAERLFARAEVDVAVVSSPAAGDLRGWAGGAALDGPAPRPALVLLSDRGFPRERPAKGLITLLPSRASALQVSAAVAAAAAGLVAFVPRRELGQIGRMDGKSAADGRAKGSGELAMLPSKPALTPREHEVLRMMADGLPNKAIAADLGITTHTVKFHIASILSKLDAESRTEAVTVGIRLGLILL